MTRLFVCGHYGCSENIMKFVEIDDPVFLLIFLYVYLSLFKMEYKILLLFLYFNDTSFGCGHH